MPPQRDPNGRQQRFNQIGEVGRITGIQPPSNIPRDSAGHENPEDFFNAADSTTGSGIASKSATRLPAVNGASTTASNKKKKEEELKTGRVRGQRPDVSNQIGERGRKTGIAPPTKVPRDAHGFESVDAYFQSPTPSKSSNISSPSTTPRANNKSRVTALSTSKKSGGSPLKRVSPLKSNGTTARDEEEEEEEDQQDLYPQDDPFAHGFGGGGSDDDDDEMRIGAGQDMDVDDGTSLTPSTYARTNGVTKSASSRAAGGGSPSKLSALSSKAQGKQRRISPSPSPEPAQNEDEEEDEDDEVIITTPKGKGRASQAGNTISSNNKRRSLNNIAEEEDDNDFGANDLLNDDNGDQGQGEEEEEEEEEEVGPSKRRQSRLSNGHASPSKANGSSKGKEKAVKEVRLPVSRKRVREEVDDENVRKSTRHRLQPLEYWRNERIIYKRRPSGMGVEAVVRIPKPPVESLVHKGRHRGHTIKRSQSARVKSEVPEEEGVDDMTDPDGVVWNHELQKDETRRVAMTQKMIQPQMLYNEDRPFRFQKIFSESEYLAGGLVEIPSGSEKGLKNSKDNCYIFYCIEGSVSVRVHRTSFAIGPGGMFFVPRWNYYSITATSNRDVKLFFTQGRQMKEGEDKEEKKEEAEQVEEEEQEEEEEDEQQEEEEVAQRSEEED